MRSFVVAAVLAVTGALGFADRADAQVYFGAYPGGVSVSVGGFGYYPGLYGYPGYLGNYGYTYPSYYSWYSRPYYGGYGGGRGYYQPYYGGYRYGGYGYGSYRGWRGRWR